MFAFHLPISGEHQIEARYGEVSDVMEIRKVEEENPAYRMKKESRYPTGLTRILMMRAVIRYSISSASFRKSGSGGSDDAADGTGRKEPR